MINSSCSCLVIAEVAQAHEGSVNLAHSYIDAIAKAGANAVKFQTHIASAESTVREPWRVEFSKQDKSRYDYWKRMEFTEQQWTELSRHAREKGLLFISSPFSTEAVDLLLRVGIDCFKIPSGEVCNVPLLEKIAAAGYPVILSSGMSSLAELDQTVALFKSKVSDLIVLQCTSAYPCPPEKLGLNLLAEYRARYNCKTGLSDHSGTIFAGLAAATLGASAIEVHVTFSKEMFGPDVPSSVTTTQLSELVAGVQFINKALIAPLDKDASYLDTLSLRNVFTKSIVARVPIKKGETITKDMIAYKKPGDGIHPEEINRVIRRKALVDLNVDDPLQWEYLGEVICEE